MSEPQPQSGVDFLKNNHQGEFSTELPDELEAVRRDITIALDELITFGARVRPLSVQGSPVGYIRGLSMAERAWVSRMSTTAVGRTRLLVSLATTLSDDSLSQFSAVEMRRLVFTIYRMGRADLALLPWVFPFSTTSTSERLWSISNRDWSKCAYPGGEFTILSPLEPLVQWNYLSTLRDESKESVKDLSNASLIVRSMIGKGAEGLFSEVRRSQNLLKLNISKPWLEVGSRLIKSVDYNDGWGHTLEDSSLEGMMREFNGMLEGDKHEQLMQAIAEDQRKRAEAHRDRLRSLRGRVAGVGFQESALTREEVLKRDQEREQRLEQERERKLRDKTALMDRINGQESSDPSRRVWDIDV